ncbi:MAG: 3-phosphoshikimate 1-carboxyvinyltransferase [Candidatus Marinimicrobia bacterium]|nr:3-phosphoshikimate 1-carboxyvinyltransferase [Candidatus Neomarinimicrobiota bacterium]
MRISLPGDKSLSHRVLMLAALAQGTSTFTNLSPGVDVAATRRCLEQCGIPIKDRGNKVVVTGGGGFKTPENDLDAGNSGTTARLLMGLLAGTGIKTRIVGDDSLSRRPMDRIVRPLQEMGAKIHISARETLPLVLYPATLNSLDYTIPVPSAQVKSALLLAGLVSEGSVTVKETIQTRNHTELMLQALGVDIQLSDKNVTIGSAKQTIPKFSMVIPGDPSAAAFPAALVTLLPDMEITFDGLLLNPTRLGFFHALRKMGGDVTWKTKKRVLGEEVGTLTVRSRLLHGLRISGDEIPALIDEIPILAVLASQAKGETVVRDAGELRLKESDRIKSICENLRRMGTRIQELSDGFRILGPARLRGAAITTYGDHRIAMAFAIAGRVASNETRLDNPDCVDISFPGYHKLMSQIAR